MKKTPGIMSVTLTVLLMSCQRDFIDLTPVDTLTTLSLYNTDEGFNQAVNGCYAGLADVYENWWMFGDLRADDVCDERIREYSYFDLFYLDVNDSTCSGTWRKLYVIVTRTNLLLFYIKNKDSAVIPNKVRYVAEAEFIRALAYFDLVRIFGDVPEITIPVTVSEAYKIPREPVANIYRDIILPDLMDAENNLPVKYTGQDIGRATSGAAKALLSEVYLTLSDFVSAEAKLSELTKAPYSYALLTDYTDLFDYSKDEHHSEYIFDIEYITGGIGLGSAFTNKFCPRDQPTIKLYKVVGNGSGALNFCPPGFWNVWLPGDKRKAITMVKGHNPFASDPFTYTLKYMFATQTGENDSPANWKVYRYADVLLMYAEALNENGKTADALIYLNMVHQRADLEVIPAGMTKLQMRDAIAMERRYELTAEGHRWFDLVRTGQALEACAFTGMKYYMTIFPVPQIQIDFYNNKEIFWQNTGYF
jgi:starch-binding outer membrane protein, SusD/RagB family